jgi:hypothetical protein
MSGSDSFAIVFVHKPTGAVYFYRNNNPIVYSYDVETGCLVFGSTQDTVLAMSTGFEHFGISTYSTLHCVSMEENHLYRIDKDGVFSKGEKIKLPFLAENVKAYGEVDLKKLEMASFFEFRRSVDGPKWDGKRSRYDTSNTSTAVYSQRPTSQPTTFGQFTPNTVFTTIKNGVLCFHVPLKYLDDVTLYA